MTTGTADALPPLDTALVRRLLDQQFPAWSGMPLTLVDPAGSDHVIHRLGSELSVRLPRHSGAVGQAGKEYTWLPRLAPHLPLPVPVPVAVGEPGCGYPWPWSVSRWLVGEAATVESLAHSPRAAEDLAEFLAALHRAPRTAPAQRPPDALTTWSLTERDTATRAAIEETRGIFDARAMADLWNAALDAPRWGGPPLWFHGDFHTGNLLTVEGRISAVIDFGELGIGDPACDLMIAFTLLSDRTRPVFRAALGVDDATWLRGRAWAMATGLNAYTTYAAVNPRVAAQTTRQITQALTG
ncbi:aminoglycoside phosphotransferase family protein [Streptomyces sp. NPDC058867]|uniref:aminoglycoside phosphotransferase family protein n=1 Tax=unclassified Streptomyces TaxID=2593676 RepID=UPI0036A2F123